MDDSFPVFARPAFGCNEYISLDLTYTEAWLNGNHARVTELARLIEEHKQVCPICRDPAGLASSLWPGAKVADPNAPPA